MAEVPLLTWNSYRLGNDGNWSTVQVLLGSSSDLVQVLPSTYLSEFLAIGPGGCSPSKQHMRWIS